MKRGRPTKAGRAIARAVVPQVLDATIASLTTRFHELKEQLLRDAVETMREMGEILEQGAARLGRRRYGAWVEQDLGISRAAASNYVRVLELSRTTPRLFLDWKELGASKMVRLARVAPRRRRTAVRKKLRGKDVHEMTDAEFAVVTRPYIEHKRKVTGNMRAHGLRMKARALHATLERACGELSDVSDAAIRTALRADLEALARVARRLRARLR
jgi:hypothetical protein